MVNNQIRLSTSEIKQVQGIKCSDILCCCECRKESAGINPQTGLPLTWRYADDYVANMNESDKTQIQNK